MTAGGPQHGQGREIPPSPLRKFEFDGGDITATARYAQLARGDPDRLLLFAAREVSARGVEVNPPATFDGDSQWSEMDAYFVGNEENIILYFLENMADLAASGFAGCWTILEIHELTHWAIPEEDNETDPDHWERWNRVIQEAVEYVMGTEFEPDEYAPPEASQETESPTTRQASLEEIAQ